VPAFLNPAALALAALSIPIILLYMLKLRRQDVPVSSTLLWQRLLRDRQANAPWQRLRSNLLLLLQLLILALLVLSLARPFFPTPAIASGNVVLLLDASASMQASDVAPSRFDAARRAARDVLSGLGANDTVTLIAVGPQPQVLASASSDRALLRRALDQAAPSDGIANWEAAFALAAAAASGESAQIVLLTDGAIPSRLPALPGQVRLVQFGRPGDNLGIVALAIREGRSGPQAFLRAINTGAAAAEVRVEFRADGALFDVRTLTIPAQGSANITLDDLPYNLTLLEARLDADDPLPLDDIAWAARSAAGSRRVLLVSPGNLFLERALGMLPGVELNRLAPGQPLPADPYDLIVFDGAPAELPAGNVWLIGAPPGASAVLTDTAITRVAVQDPLLRYVDWSSVHILRAWQVEPPAGARVLVEAAGHPLLYVAERPGGRLAVLTFDLHDSDLPLQIAFPILVANLTGWLLPPGGVGETAARPGAPVTIQPAPEADRVAVTTPAGQPFTLPVGENIPVFAETNRLGVYQITQIDADNNPLRTDYFTVNLFDAAESDIAPRESVWIGQTEVRTTPPERAGQLEIWPWLAAAALGVLAGEWWAFHEGGWGSTQNVKRRT